MGATHGPGDTLVAAWSGEFVDPAVEAAFAAATLDEDRRRGRIMGLVVPAVTLLYVYMDIEALAGAPEVLAVATRIVQATAAATLLGLRPRTWLGRQRHVFAVGLAVVVTLVVDDFIYAQLFPDNGEALRWLWLYAVVFITYVVLPLSLGRAALLGTIASVGFIASEASARGDLGMVRGFIILTAMMNAVSWLFAALLRRSRRLEYALLHNLFPAEIVRRLRSGESATDQVSAATVLFADIVGFTTLAAELPAAQLLAILDELFSEFDRLAAARGVEKIKTIGDCYMASSGIPTARADHAEAIADLALDMQAVIRARTFGGLRLSLRIGIHSGPVIAGVIGQRRQLYDLWGATVNTASRMESHGERDEIQVSEATAGLLADTHVLRPRGPIEVKGIGVMTTFFLAGRREA